MSETHQQFLKRLERGLASIEPLDDAVVAILRGKTPAQRLEMSFAATRGMRILMEAAIREEHAHWDDTQVKRELVRRWLAMAED